MGRPIRILELRSVRGIGGGPEKTIFRGTARTDPHRFRITVCYIRDGRDDQYVLDRMASLFSVDYVEIAERHSFDAAIWPALRRLVRERGIDIVHAHEYKSDLLAWLLARTEGVIPLATAHGWTGESARERRFYYPADRWLLRRFPRVIAVSSEIRKTLMDAGARPDRVLTVLNGIDAGAFTRRRDRLAGARARLGVPQDVTVIGSLGRLEPQKRFDLLIDAFATLCAGRRDLRLVIAGEGSQRDALAAHAAARGLADTCILAGHCTDVADTLNAFDLFVQSSDYEGTPNAVLEAMAMEVPIVATDVGGTRELIDDGVHGVIVPPRRPDLVAAALAAALNDPAATQSRVHAARQRVEGDLSFENRMKAVERVYDNLMNERNNTVPRTAVVA